MMTRARDDGRCAVHRLPWTMIVQTAATMRCSVVVPSCERPALLARTLRALVAQTLAPDEYEIIVCDDTASDAARSMVEQCRQASAVSIRYVAASPPRQGRAAMRNTGWKLSRAEIVAFTDDDVVPDSDWLRQGLLALEGDDADAASGRIVVPLPDESADSADDTARLGSGGFITANCFCRRWVLDCIGGFETRPALPGQGDSDLFLGLLEAGFDVVHATDAVVVRPERPRPFGAYVESTTALVLRLLYALARRGGRSSSRLGNRRAVMGRLNGEPVSDI